MNEKQPLVSIGLAVYNGEKYLAQAIDSILAQTFTDFELVISDNASTDSTQSICEAYAARDARIKYSRNTKNIGGANNENLVFRRSIGKYFHLAAHDDLMAAAMLEKCVGVLEQDPSVVLCYPHIAIIDEHGHQTGMITDRRALSESAYERFRDLTGFDHDCETTYGVIRADVMRKTGLQQNYSDSDRTFLCHLALYGKYYQIPEVLFYKRVHPLMSTQVFTEIRNRMAWFGEDFAKRKSAPYLSQFLHYIRIIATTPMPLRERMRCYFHMLFWVTKYRRWRSIPKDMLLVAYQFILDFKARLSGNAKKQSTVDSY